MQHRVGRIIPVLTSVLVAAISLGSLHNVVVSTAQVTSDEPKPILGEEVGDALGLSGGEDDFTQEYNENCVDGEVDEEDGVGYDEDDTQYNPMGLQEWADGKQRSILAVRNIHISIILFARGLIFASTLQKRWSPCASCCDSSNV
jgi:hypothetical protein